MEKIGMCMACGDQSSKQKTVLFLGQEMCFKCADMMGYDSGDERDDAELFGKDSDDPPRWNEDDDRI